MVSVVWAAASGGIDNIIILIAERWRCFNAQCLYIIFAFGKWAFLTVLSDPWSNRSFEFFLAWQFLHVCCLGYMDLTTDWGEPMDIGSW